MMNRFLDAFRSVVCAPTEIQMRALWDSAIANGTFPHEAVEYVRKSYYEHPKAYKLMECYVYNCGNLHQTSTSRNEGSHAAFRSKTPIIPKPAESYLLRRKHNILWMRQLRSNALNSQNRIPHDIRMVLELRDLVRKVSLFALTEIRRQIAQAKKEESEGTVRDMTWEQGRCECHTYHRYGLPCWHMVPTDSSAIPLEHIAPFWRIDNWNRGSLLQKMS